MSDLPREVSRGFIEIGGMRLEVVNLDNGQRVLTAQGIKSAMDFLTGDDILEQGEDGEA